MKEERWYLAEMGRSLEKSILFLKTVRTFVSEKEFLKKERFDLGQLHHVLKRLYALDLLLAFTAMV